jgi:hypothetical protein
MRQSRNEKKTLTFSERLKKEKILLIKDVSKMDVAGHGDRVAVREKPGGYGCAGENGDLYLRKFEKKFLRIRKSAFLVVQRTGKLSASGGQNPRGKKLTANRRVRGEKNRIEFMNIFAFRSF